LAEVLVLRAWLPVRPTFLYSLWMNSRRHSEFSGSPAVIEPHENGEFTAVNGYIHGISTHLIPGKKIVQSWRTRDFPEDAPDSELELLMEPFTGGTVITLVHRNLPPDQIDDYRVFWEEQYLQPLKEYLERIVDGEDMH